MAKSSIVMTMPIGTITASNAVSMADVPRVLCMLEQTSSTPAYSRRYRGRAALARSPGTATVEIR